MTTLTRSGPLPTVTETAAKRKATANNQADNDHGKGDDEDERKPHVDVTTALCGPHSDSCCCTDIWPRNNGREPL